MSNIKDRLTDGQQLASQYTNTTDYIDDKSISTHVSTTMPYERTIVSHYVFKLLTSKTLYRAY